MSRVIWWLDSMSAAMNIFTACYLYQVFGDVISRAVLVSFGAIVIILLFVQVEFLLRRLKRSSSNVLGSDAGEFSS